ncbi:hypothetical protein DSM112329_02291 [Paraconexibacter sp. AEG42_29]|uniref:Uncharacterized protein n=1 Tax=Paraconexibacter sp. AEG42_29 TaxID=2997339 RepID=A0AAU7AUX0_9ACTN
MRIQHQTRLLVCGALAACVGISGAASVGAFAADPGGTPGSYWLGEQFAGLPLTDSTDSNYSYGDCEASGDAGCAPPLQVQNRTSCDRNPIGLDSDPPRVTTLRGGALVARYGGGTADVGTGRRTVTVFAVDERALTAALLGLRRRTQDAPPSALARPVYPRAVLLEIRRAVDARKLAASVPLIAQRTGVPVAGVRTRLAMARALGPGALRGVPAPRRSWKAVSADRQLVLDASLGRAPATSAKVKAAAVRVRGLVGDC